MMQLAAQRTCQPQQECNRLSFTAQTTKLSPCLIQTSWVAVTFDLEERTPIFNFNLCNNKNDTKEQMVFWPVMAKVAHSIPLLTRQLAVSCLDLMMDIARQRALLWSPRAWYGVTHLLSMNSLSPTKYFLCRMELSLEWMSENGKINIVFWWVRTSITDNVSSRNTNKNQVTQPRTISFVGPPLFWKVNWLLNVEVNTITRYKTNIAFVSPKAVLPFYL